MLVQVIRNSWLVLAARGGVPTPSLPHPAPPGHQPTTNHVHTHKASLLGAGTEQGPCGAPTGYEERGAKAHMR